MRKVTYTALALGVLTLTTVGVLERNIQASAEALASHQIPEKFIANKISINVIAAPEYIQATNAVKYNYSISSLPTSLQNLAVFAVQKDASVSQDVTPSGWNGGDVAGVPYWSWATNEIGNDLAPGQTAGGFSFLSLTLPGIGRYYAQGEKPIPNINEIPDELSEEEFATQLDIFHNSTSGYTVGPSSVTTSSSSASMINHLITQKHLAESIGWIDNDGIVKSLDAKLDAASASLEKGNQKSAKNNLRSFIQELNAQSNKHVNYNARSILLVGAEVALRNL